MAEDAKPLPSIVNFAVPHETAVYLTTIGHIHKVKQITKGQRPSQNTITGQRGVLAFGIVAIAVRLLGLQAVITNPDFNVLVFEHRCGSSISILTPRLRHLLPEPEPGEASTPVPRFGTVPRLFEKERFSEVRFSSRILSRGGGGGGTGFGSMVGVAALSGRKMVLKPFPTKSPTNAESGPRGGGGADGVGRGKAGRIQRACSCR